MRVLKKSQGGKVLIIFVALAAFAGSLLVFSGIQPYLHSATALNEQQTALSALESRWKGEKLTTTPETGSKPSGSATERSRDAVKPKTGEVYSMVTVPRFGHGYKKVLLEGDADSSDATNKLLNTGNLVHYATTAQAGEKGNFAISGHRTGWGGVLRPIQKIELDDEIIVQTSAEETFKYRVIKEPRKISSQESEVLYQPIPGDLRDRSLMTITTCEVWDLSQRIVVVLELVKNK